MPSAWRAWRNFVPRQAAERLALVAKHVEMIGVPRAALVHLGGQDAGDLLEHAGQVLGVLLAGPRLLLEPGHLGQQQVALELGHPQVGAPAAEVGEVVAGGGPGAVVVLEGVAPLGELRDRWSGSRPLRRSSGSW